MKFNWSGIQIVVPPGARITRDVLKWLTEVERVFPGAKQNITVIPPKPNLTLRAGRKGNSKRENTGC